MAIAAPLVVSHSVSAQSTLLGAHCVSTAIWLLIYVGGIAWWGMTPGKWLFGLRATNLEGKPLGLGRSLIRLIVYLPNQVLAAAVLFAAPLLPQQNFALELATFGVNGLTSALLLGSVVLMAQTDSQRALHDYAAGSRVCQRT